MKKSFVYIIGVILFTSCFSHFEIKQGDNDKECFDSLMKTKTLTVTLNYNSIDYYIYKGKPMGFQLELLNAFAKHMGLSLEIETRSNTAEDFESLINSKSRILVGNFTNTSLRRLFFLFSEPHSRSRIVLIQRKENDSLQVNNMIDFEGKTICVTSQSSYSDYINSALFEQKFKPIFAFKNDNSNENLIELVSNKTIDYTVCEEKAAKVYANYYDNIDYSIVLSDTLNLAWVFHPKNKILKDSVDAWLKEYVKTTEYKNLYKKYYMINLSSVGFTSTMNNRNKRHLSIYDKTLQKVSKKYHWDWRIYASIIYQESKFQDGLIGEGGSFGILQFMPSTAEQFGIKQGLSGDEQIVKGAKLIRNMEERYEKEVRDKEQLWKFIIAAFRAGIGHVDDARVIAKVVGKNPNVWDHNVDSCMVLESMPKYYNMPEVKSGYHFGKQTLIYVNNVWGRYLHYCNVYKK